MAQARSVPRQALTTTADGARSVVAADIDEDGDLDVLSASQLDDTVGWFENLDGAGAFGARVEISTLAGGAASVVAPDIDGDGDLDALAAAAGDSTVLWYENEMIHQSALFPLETAVPSPDDPISAGLAADFDGDGDPDLALVRNGSLEWRENLDGLGTFDPVSNVIDVSF